MESEDNARNPLESMLLDTNAEPEYLPLSLLKAVTNDFSNDHKIGSGGFANVYKGLLKNGTVAVKKLSETVDIDEKSFNQEVSCLKGVKHKNIVRFLGYCADTQGKVGKYKGKVVMLDERQRLLCFEFMPNKSLDNHISDASRGPDWRTRYKIIKGICEGLDYLHQQKIVHLDLKPANILLDHSMVPKIADFGVSKSFDEKQTRLMTTNVYGSMGYMAPEFFGGLITFKSDIYSLGTIIIEMLTGRKGCPEIEDVLKNWRTRFETSHEGKWLEHVKLCTEIGIDCTEFNPTKRPTTRDIIKRLDKMDSTCGFIETDPCTSSETQANYTSPKSRKPCIEGQHENVDALINCVGKKLGYSAGKPIAAFTIYKCLVHWNSFKAERTSVFDRLIQLIGSALENDDENHNLAYWLSNTTFLVLLLHRSLKAAGAPGSVSRKNPHQPTSSLFGRIAKGFRYAPLANLNVEATDVVCQVEAKYPALLFKQQVTAYMEKIYGSIRDNIKKELSSPISLCIQASRKTKASNLHVSRKLSGESQINHWQKIIEGLDNLLTILQDNHVPTVLSQKIISQIFSYINVQLFNSLLLRRECCSLSHGEYIKAGLAEMELWCANATNEYAGSSWDELKHIRQAVVFLVIFQKPRFSYDELVNDMCPNLSVQQLYRICTVYSDDKYNTQSVSSEVLSTMRVLMTEDSNDVESSSFLLDDNSSIPFTVDDITNSMQNDFSDVKPAEELLEDPAFFFLQR